MTNSMIPYSFVPGTKAKASEVNANFLSLANVITQNQTVVSGNIQSLQETVESMTATLAQKANKSELQTTFIVSETNKNLDSYITAGTYIFDFAHSPTNSPSGGAGILVVTGHKDVYVKQFWYSKTFNEAVFTRIRTENSWSGWSSSVGSYSLNNSGYLKMPNGIIIQWGHAQGSSNNYPIAFPSLACVLVTKAGSAGNFERSDSGLSYQSLTGFSYTTFGYADNFNWIAVGY